MRRLLICLVFTYAWVYTALAQPVPDHLTIWYKQPATAWEEALPLGNGKTGAMIFGGVSRERFQLNDNTLWSGYPDPGNNPNGIKYLPLVRRAVNEGDYAAAEA